MTKYYDGETAKQVTIPAAAVACKILFCKEEVNGRLSQS